MTSAHRKWVLAIALGTAAAMIVGWRGALSGSGAAEDAGQKRVANTATVERKTLREAITAPGSLSYSGSSALSAGRSGTITRLPSEGRTVKLGAVLYSIDNQPVVLLRGQFPVWRAFGRGMSDGPDVRQVTGSVGHPETL
jgi:multidrug efflux pump subunit AcrA (membrane-fusion protein)